MTHGVRTDLDQSAVLKLEDFVRVEPPGIGVTGGGCRFRCDPGKNIPAFFRAQAPKHLPGFPICLHPSGRGIPTCPFWRIRITRPDGWRLKLQQMQLIPCRKGYQTGIEFSVEDQTLQFVPPEGISLPCDNEQCGW